MRIPGRDTPVSRREALRITAVAGVTLALGGGLTGAILRQAGLQRRSATRTRLGTRVTISLYHPSTETAQALVEAAFAEIDRLETILSRHRSDSAVSRLSRDGTLAEPPAELQTVLRRAAEISEWSGGAFDVTMAPLLSLYEAHYREPQAVPPSAAAISKALALIDYRRLRVENSGIAFEHPGMSLTLDGIAKGYVVDRTVEVLRDGGADQVLVEAGGDLRVSGEEGRGPAETIGIQNPLRPEKSLGTVRLRGAAVASSGDSMQHFTSDRRLHHILDPRTGVSPPEASGVTVIAPSAMDADAYSTAVFVLGPTEGIALLDRLEGVEGLFVTKEGRELRTREFPALSASVLSVSNVLPG